MANDDEPVDKPRPLAHPPTDLPAAETPTPVPRLGRDDVVPRYDGVGDVDGVVDAVPCDEQGELGGARAPGTADDPGEVVDVPVEIGRPFSRAAKRRNQRRLPG
ncbi:hypothetical protein [Plantactinospora sonchi]|uniref:Uncharacterized protein n=1 Tax=Plantactinospora sonchi TaxID=1544735 RepID=A0ABU7RRW3_9ACTN